MGEFSDGLRELYMRNAGLGNAKRILPQLSRPKCYLETSPVPRSLAVVINWHPYIRGRLNQASGDAYLAIRTFANLNHN